MCSFFHYIQISLQGNYHSRLLSAIIAGLCHPNVKLRSTFSLLSSNRESKSIVSPSDNSGLPMLLSTENHQYPVLVEQMIYRTQVGALLLLFEFSCATDHKNCPLTYNRLISSLLNISVSFGLHFSFVDSLAA